MSSTMSQPTAMCPSGVSTGRVHEDAHQDDGAGDGQGDADDGARPRPADGERRRGMPSRVATTICPSGAGEGDAPHREEVLEVEVQADAEHQQHDADLGELAGELGSAENPGVFGPMATPASR